MDEKEFKKTYGLDPIKMIDLKSLMGDASDHIPGVKGIGEKTALTLLQKYNSLEGVYENIDEIKGATREKLINDKENAFFSKELATIYKEVPIDVDLEKIKYEGISSNYNEILEDLEFYSYLKKNEKQDEPKDIKINILKNIDDLKIEDNYALYIEVHDNYHDKDIKGVALYNDKISCYIPFNLIKENTNIFNNDYQKYTYDLKKLLVCLKYHNIKFSNNFDDLMLMGYLLNYNIKDDLSYLMNNNNTDIIFNEQLYKDKELTEEKIANHALLKARYIYENKDKMLKEVQKENYLSLYNDMELPLSYILADMEYTGVYVSRDVLDEMKAEIKIKLDIISNEIYNLAGVEFNILSPKQLGKILFEKLQIPYPRKIKDDNYSTSSDIFSKLRDYPIIEKVIDYRALAKLYSNYAVGLADCIREDGKIHTTFNQTLTRTGRLSSANPNLQNIPIREEYGRLVRKAFIPSKNSVLLSSDYSQIELRVFAHMSKAENLMEAFNKDMDIHTKTAMDIFHVPEIAVTKDMRRNAKAVNFGILYGISSFGLSEDLKINVKEAKEFIEHYLETFPGIKDFMDSLIKDAYENGYVKTLFGRKRYIEELKNTNYMIKTSGERTALNTPIQGTAADILKKAMVKIYEEFSKRELKSKMIIQVHDELVFDLLESEKDEVIKIITDIMENIYKLDVPLKVDINYGSNWYEAK